VLEAPHESCGVDTEEDLKRAEHELRRQPAPGAARI
jgi:CMP-2-keto-3-deoxyoctulosonic acid synthetase